MRLRTHDESHTDPSCPTLTPWTSSCPSPLPPPPICLSSLSHPYPICPVPLSPLSHLSVISLGFSLSSLAHNCTPLVRQTHSFHQRAQEGIFLGRALTEKPLLWGTNLDQTSITPKREKWGRWRRFHSFFLSPTV